MATLVVVDVTRIQTYIFGSNRLQENVGASYLVESATGEWAFEAVIAAAGKSHNIADQYAGQLIDREFDANSLVAEVLYEGGGIFVVLFRDKESAKVFTRHLSRHAITEAPGLNLRIHHHETDYQQQSLSTGLADALYELAHSTQTQQNSTPVLGLSVSVMCQSTGLPAVGEVIPAKGDASSAYPASAEILAKTKTQTQEQANKRLHHKMLLETADFQFPLDFEKLGRSEGEHSYIAVVHADGNGIGQIIMQLGKTFTSPKDNRAYINTMRAFSRCLRQASQAALQDTQTALIDWLLYGSADGDESPAAQSLRESTSHNISQEGRLIIPFRPLIIGGDDVTFVCDGRLGVSLGIRYVERFNEHVNSLLAAQPWWTGKPLSASAGVAIVKSHYPFVRAYQLAEALCGSAKTYRRRLGAAGSAIDWHFATTGLSGNIRTIRHREYTVQDGSLTLRPVMLGDNPLHPIRKWSTVEQGIYYFQGPKWRDKRNKAKALRDALREGPHAVTRFCTLFQETLPSLDDLHAPELLATGWWPKPNDEQDEPSLCGYFDALELADWYVPI